MPDPVSERMRADWNQRARDDAHYFVAFGGRDQSEAEFLATAADVLRSIEGQLKRLPQTANRRTYRALEIGCGPGRLVKPLSRHFGEIHGVDVADEMIRLARERLANIPHAHFHTTDGASLPQFADESFDFIYSYAVFQHIPSRDVVLEYMREIRRLLKPGGVFHGQFNGVAPPGAPDTWSGVSFSADDIHAFTRENGLELLNLEGEHTQYLWTTWRRALAAPLGSSDRQPIIRRITNAYTGDSLIPQRGRQAALSIWINHLPPDCDLNNIEILVEGVPGVPIYIGPADSQGLQQVNAWLPEGVRTGLVPVELRVNGRPLCPLASARVIPAGPMVPRIISVTDGVNLVLKNSSNTGLVKVHIEEVMSPDTVRVTIDDQPAAQLEIFRIDPRPPRHLLDIVLPKGLSAGSHMLQIHIGPRRVLTAPLACQ
ncbi:MAG: methyltransferase domain-containing protein [Bryobacteraceae bacterium]|jgi:SAM-dependent methyltransferase